jgi:hypothetical protein
VHRPSLPGSNRSSAALDLGLPMATTSFGGCFARTHGVALKSRPVHPAQTPPKHKV